MNKRVISSFIVAIMLVISSVSGFGTGISINGEEVQFTSDSGAPFIDASSRTQVPLRATMEAFGCEVDWEQSTQTAIVLKDDITVRVPIGQKYIMRNGVRIENDTFAQIKDSRTYLPIRVVLEAFGANVLWDNTSKTVLVSYIPIGDSVMTIHFIDVGQADSIFIDYNEYEILIDGGNKSDGRKVADYIKPYVDGNIEIVVATHIHADHIGGLTEVINTYNVDTIIHSEEIGSTITYNDFYNAAISNPNTSYLGDGDSSYNMGDNAYFRVLEMGDGYSNTNNNSVISMIDFGEIQILFMGDLESDIEKKNLAKFEQIEILKAGHHGSNTSSSAEFLNKIKPETVIVSAGIGNSYGHPHKEALERFSMVGADAYGTFKDGTIVVTTNGQNYIVNASNKLTLSDAGGSSGGTTVSPPAEKPKDNSKPTTADAPYIGNKNTKKFHDKGCRHAKSIADKNIIYFNERADAINKGYAPCKVCNP